MIQKVTAVAESMPFGQKVTAAIIEYNTAIRAESLHKETYIVLGRSIVEVYVSDEEIPGKHADIGKYVILELDPEDTDAGITGMTYSLKNNFDKNNENQRPKFIRKIPRVTVSQVLPIVSVQGEIIAPDPEEIFLSRSEKNLVADDFRVFRTAGILYNLYIPSDYSPEKKYPLVLYIHDAQPSGDDPMLTLAHGIGAICWALPEEQKKHECFVMAPQISSKIRMTNDQFQVAPELENVKAALDHVVERFSIDKERIYTTGQSMGCMASCELLLRYPDNFAAALLVAGQWDPERMGKVLFRKNMWILVSSGDAKAFPGMNAVTAALEKNGANVGKYVWDAKAPLSALNDSVHQAQNDGCNIHYTVFKGNSVIPEGVNPGPMEHHISTWHVVYSIEALRDWLLSQNLQKEDVNE